MKDDKNFQWTMDDIAHQYKIENQDWSWSQCWDKARVVYRELNKLNNQMWKDTELYFNHNTPFSFFESEDGTLSSIPTLDEI